MVRQVLILKKIVVTVIYIYIKGRDDKCDNFKKKKKKNPSLIKRQGCDSVVFGDEEQQTHARS